MATENSLIAVDSLADKDKVRVVVANGEDGLSRNITVENLKETLLLNSLTTRVETLETSAASSNTKQDQMDTSITDLRLDLGRPGSSPEGVFSDLINIQTDLTALQDQNVPLIKENLQKVTNRVTLLDGLNGAVPVLQDQQNEANEALISLDTRKLNKTTFEAFIANSGTGLYNTAEVISARGDKETLGARLNDIDVTLDSKSDKIYVDSKDALKADKTYVDSQDLLKANITYVDSKDALKADKTYVDSQDLLKANITYVDSKDALKADKTYVDAQDLKQMPISGGVLENYREKLVTLSGTSTTIDLSLGNVFTHSLTGYTNYSITNTVSGQVHSFTLIINQTATVRALTFPASVKWQGGEIPDLRTANKTYVLTFMTVNGGATWLGMFGGEF